MGSYYFEEKKIPKYCSRMASWSSYFHRSDADDFLARALRGIRENVVALQVVLGNQITENSLVHGEGLEERCGNGQGAG